MLRSDGPPREIAEALARAGFCILDSHPAVREQTHLSWRVDTDEGAVWAKVEGRPSPVAGVAREIRALTELSDFSLLPRLVLSGTTEDGTPFMITREVAGRVVAEDPLATDWQLSTAQGLRDFGRIDADRSQSFRQAGRDLFGDAPDVSQLLRDALRELATPSRNLPPALVAAAGAAVRAEESVLLHGSLHVENVVCDGAALTALLDLEAVRVGPASLDIAAMAGSLLDGDITHLAWSWVEVCRQTFVPWHPANVAAHLALRGLLRASAGALMEAESRALGQLVLELLKEAAD